MSGIVIAVFCPRMPAAVLVLVLPNIVHLLYFQQLHYKNHNELHKAGGGKREIFRNKKQMLRMEIKGIIVQGLNKNNKRKTACPHQEPVDVHEKQGEEKRVEEEVEGDAGDGLEAGHTRGVHDFEWEPVETEPEPERDKDGSTILLHICSSSASSRQNNYKAVKATKHLTVTGNNRWAEERRENEPNADRMCARVSVQSLTK